jgi:hypothetical protein
VKEVPFEVSSLFIRHVSHKSLTIETSSLAAQKSKTASTLLTHSSYLVPRLDWT